MITTRENAAYTNAVRWEQTREWRWFSDRTGLLWIVRWERENWYTATVESLRYKHEIPATSCVANDAKRYVYLSARTGKWMPPLKTKTTARTGWRTLASAQEACVALDKNEPALDASATLKRPAR